MNGKTRNFRFCIQDNGKIPRFSIFRQSDKKQHFKLLSIWPLFILLWIFKIWWIKAVLDNHYCNLSCLFPSKARFYILICPDLCIHFFQLVFIFSLWLGEVSTLFTSSSLSSQQGGMNNISLSKQFKQSCLGSLNNTQWIFFFSSERDGLKKHTHKKPCKKMKRNVSRLPWVSDMTVFIQQMFMVCPFVPSNTVLTSLPNFKLQLLLNAIKIKVIKFPVVKGTIFSLFPWSCESLK